ncbi:MSMEG_0570 family nitrogen starvation response protein [Nocardioides sp. NPDC087217]|uniref:MSMEG_0570 family nitrogen starvation response protein n=1 Tax=Nocardioides sp. NPDC087217 TaxID=3364335 RepID=UPI003815DAB2
MPEMTFTVRWPDGRVEDCYSPSLVMHDHLTVGGTYAVEDFLDRSLTALATASERVRVKFGFACTSAMATSDQLRASAAAYEFGQRVTVLAMHPPLPVAPNPQESR